MKHLGDSTHDAQALDAPRLRPGVSVETLERNEDVAGVSDAPRLRPG